MTTFMFLFSSIRHNKVAKIAWTNNFFSIIFQNFLAANSQCWWNTPLTAATRSLKYAGHVAPGMLLVTAEPCALEILRGAYARSVLKPPATYLISSVGKFCRHWNGCYCFSLSINGFKFTMHDALTEGETIQNCRQHKQKKKAIFELNILAFSSPKSNETYSRQHRLHWC